MKKIKNFNENYMNLSKKIEEVVYERKDFKYSDKEYIEAILLYRIFEDSTKKIYRINRDQRFDFGAYENLYKSMYVYELESLKENFEIIIDMLDNKKAYSFIKNNLDDYKKYYVK